MEATNIHTLSFISQIHWRPGIGDPTVVGWLTVIAYFSTFFFSAAYARRLGDIIFPERGAVERKLWWIIALTLLLLGINKQLDVQSLFTDVGRVLARQEGWYRQRRIVQTWFIAGIAFAGFFSLVLMWRSFRNVWRENWLSLVGMVFLICFIVIRATSFHGIDRLLGFNLAGLKMNWVLELGGITCIFLSAVIKLKRLNKIKRGVIISQNNFL